MSVDPDNTKLAAVIFATEVVMTGAGLNEWDKLKVLTILMCSKMVALGINKKDALEIVEIGLRVESTNPMDLNSPSPSDVKH